MMLKGGAGNAYCEFVEDVGVPSQLVIDQSKEKTLPGTVFVQVANWVKSPIYMVEKHSRWQNRSEIIIGLFE